MLDLLLVHVARGDRTDNRQLAMIAKRKDDKDVPPLGRSSDRAMPFFRIRWMRVVEQIDRPVKHGFDRRLGQAVFAALGPIPFVPIESARHR